jgi:hypothetical protein
MRERNYTLDIEIACAIMFSVNRKETNMFKPRINWDDYNTVRRLTDNTVVRGEEMTLTDAETEEINARLQDAINVLSGVHSLLLEARKRFATR